MDMLQDFGPLHYNADYLYGYSHDGNVVWRTSDHDPLAATFARPVLHITKTVETAHTPVRLGDAVTYTLVVVNREHKDAGAVLISDVLPSGVTGTDLDWTGTITANSQVEFSFQAVVTTNTAFYGQTIENTAYYSYTGVRGSDSASFVIESAPLPSLTIAKRVEILREPVRPGDSITYTILVRNDGGQVATGVDLVDVLPPETDFDAWVISPTHTTVADDVILWDGRVSVGQVITWTFVAKTIAAHDAVIVNKATIQYDGGLSEANATFTLEPEPLASIVINEIMTSPAVVLDSKGEWIELYNAGSSPVDLNGCVLRDDGTDSHVIDNGGPLVINPGAYLVLGNNDNSSSNGGVAIVYAYTDLNLENTVDQVILECYGKQVDRVDYSSGSGRPGLGGASMQLMAPMLDNNVSANWCRVTTAWPGGAGDGGTPSTANNCPLADLSIAKTVMTARAPQTTVQSGEALTYTIVVANDGEADATAVRVRDILPSSLAGTDLDQVVDIAAGDRKTFVIPATVTTDSHAYTQTIVNTAYYHHSSGSGSDSASVVFDQKEPKLSITKTVGSVHNPVRLGEPVAYTITVANEGDVTATGVVMSDVLPLGLSLGGCLRGECTARLLPPDNTLYWNLNIVPAGQSYTFRFVATLTTNAAFCGETITNTVTYTSTNAGGGASDAAFVIEPSFLFITTTVKPAHASIQLGDLVTYTIVVANHSDDDAHGVVISDDLPAGVWGADLNWSGTVTANDQVEFTILAKVMTDTVYYNWSIVNTAYYSHTSGGGSDDAILIVQAPHRIFLPVITPKR
jgi:uncharacterized repeat protein (TIGR01451 family)